MDKTLMAQIAELMERVHAKRGWERAAVAGRDCLLEWDERGKNGLIETMEAWDDSILPDSQQTDTERHGAWVPAIPL
jgi:hypothetical protein